MNNEYPSSKSTRIVNRRIRTVISTAQTNNSTLLILCIKFQILPETNNKNLMQSLGKLAAKSTLWTFLGYGVNQALRLGSNLILTRLLVP